MKTVGEIKNAMRNENIMGQFEKYAEKLGMTVDETLIDMENNAYESWDAIYEDVESGGMKNMLDEEVA